MPCDFCHDPEPKVMFANPEIHDAVTVAGQVLRCHFEQGHFAACSECARLLTTGQVAALAQRGVQRNPSGRHLPAMARKLLLEQLVRVYSQVSRTEEPLLEGRNYHQRFSN